MAGDYITIDLISNTIVIVIIEMPKCITSKVKS